MTLRILAVDDEPRNLRLLTALLDPLGHEIVLADGGKKALATLATTPIDLGLLDLAMPFVDGLTVLRSMRAQADAPHVPVIVVTAHTDYESRRAALSASTRRCSWSVWTAC